jgi:hypothetical protein
MNVLLNHIDLGPLLYGFVMFIGLGLMFYKLCIGAWLSLIIDITVFVIVFRLHGGTMTGGFAAMVCALLAGLFFPFMIRRIL